MKNCLDWPLRWQQIHILEHLPSTVCWLNCYRTGKMFHQRFLLGIFIPKNWGYINDAIWRDHIFSDGLVQAPTSYGLLWENEGTKTPEKWWLKRQPGKKGAMDLFEKWKLWDMCVCLWYGPVPFWYSLWYMVGDGFRYLKLFRGWQKVCYPKVSFNLTASVILTNQEMVDNCNNIPSWMRKLTLGRTHILVQELNFLLYHSKIDSG